jgi:hypothetical protein
MGFSTIWCVGERQFVDIVIPLLFTTQSVMESMEIGGSGAPTEETRANRPNDWRELNHYLNQVREAAETSHINMPAHDSLLGLEHDAYTYTWTPDCQAQFEALVRVTGLAYKTPPPEAESQVTHCDPDCCPQGIHVHGIEILVDIVVEDPVWSSPTWGI